MGKIGFGGGCHWCTEAVFQSLIGVNRVKQGFIASKDGESSHSEAVIVHYDPRIIALKDLIEIHLHTHKSTSRHSMRHKYRSAVYAFDKVSRGVSQMILNELQNEFEDQIITRVLPFKEFKPSDAQFHSYYFSNPNKPFCETYISPKLKLLMSKYSGLLNQEKFNMSCGSK